MSKDGLLRSGRKEFKNNRNYYCREEWQEYANGEINVVKFKDDGFGQKTCENFTMVKINDKVQYEFSN